MIEDKSKSTRQDSAIETWRINKGMGTFNFVPRFGKTRVASKIVDKVLNKNPDSKILATAPNEITIKNLIKHLDSRVIFATRNQIVRNFEYYSNEKFDLILVDEIHRFLDHNGLKILELESKFKLGLTGDKLSVENNLLLKSNGFPVIDVITEEEAIAKGWISSFVEYNLGVDIEDYKIDDYIAFSRRIKDIADTYQGLHKRMNTVFGRKIFNSDMDLVYSLYTGTKYFPPNSFKPRRIPPEVVRGELAETMGWSKDLDISIDLNAKIDRYFNPSHLQETGKLFNEIIRERNNLIINSKNKIQAVLDIIARNPVPTIIFNESTNMADLIASGLGKEAIEYYSNMESRYIKNPDTGEYICYKNGNPIKFGVSRLKKLAIEGMKTGAFKYLCTVKALNEGVDIPVLSQVITTGGTINPSTHLQRVARGKTIYDKNPDKVTIIINVYIKDFEHGEDIITSRDASKLSIRQKDSTVYWVNTIDEIFSDID